MQNVVQKVPGWTSAELHHWRGTPEVFPTFLRRFSVSEQREKEEEIDEVVEKAARRKTEHRELSDAEKASLRHRIRGSVTRQLSTSEDPANQEFLDECERTAEEFIQQTRVFDPSLSEDDIHQALRNQWVFNSLQKLLGEPLTLTPSSFAYSLLYPYTDNILDRGQRSERDVATFLNWITSRLEGKVSTSRDPQTVPVGRLIAMVETEFPRDRFADVYGGLLSIHLAQQKNLVLLTPHAPMDPAAVLPLSFEKGGTSVLADGYLLSGSLHDDPAQAMFAYGVALQMIDDLQDVKEDMAAHQTSLFTLEATRRPLDETTSRLLRYVHDSVSPRLGSLHSSAPALTAMIEQSCVYLTLEAVARHSCLYSAEYLSRIEHFMPVRLPYLADAREKVTNVTPGPQRTSGIGVVYSRQ